MAVGDKKILVTQDFTDLTYDKKSDATDDLNTYDSAKRASAKAVANLNDRIDTLETSVQSLSGGGSSYVLPVATNTILGGIKVGSGLTITNGVLSADGGSGGSLNQVKYNYVATFGQTVFNAVYNVGYIDVYLNGIRLDESEFTATDETTIVLGLACQAGDIINISGYNSINTADPYSRTEMDLKLGNINSILDAINGVVI